MDAKLDIRSHGGLLLRILLLGYAAYLLATLLSFPFGRDQGTFGVVARTMLDGGVPYRDVWDHKTPGIFLAYALAQLLFGEHMISIRLLEAMALLALGWAFVRYSEQITGARAPGYAGTLLAWTIYVQLDFWHTAQAEGFAACAIATSLPIAERLRRDPLAERSGYVLLGLLVGVTGLLKPHLALALAMPLAVVGASLWQRRAAPSAILLRAGGVAAGTAVVVGVMLLYFAWSGALSDFLSTVVGYNSGHVALSWSQTPLPVAAGRVLAQFLDLTTPLAWLGIAFAVTFGRRDMRPGLVMLAGIVGILLLGVMTQGKYFPYHYASLLPFAGLGAGWGYWRFWEAEDRSPRITALLVAVCLTIPATSSTNADFAARNLERLEMLLHPAHRLDYADELYAYGDFALAENLLVAEWLERNTEPQDRVYVWGFEPLVYFLSGRPLGSRYLFNIPMRATWSRDAYRAALMDELAAHEPEVLLVMSDDVLPWVSGNERDSRDELEQFPELESLLDARYALRSEIGDFEIYVRARADDETTPLPEPAIDAARMADGSPNPAWERP